MRFFTDFVTQFEPHGARLATVGGAVRIARDDALKQMETLSLSVEYTPDDLERGS
jgi:hypothetical protein